MCIRNLNKNISNFLRRLNKFTSTQNKKFPFQNTIKISTKSKIKKNQHPHQTLIQSQKSDKKTNNESADSTKRKFESTFKITTRRNIKAVIISEIRRFPMAAKPPSSSLGIFLNYSSSSVRQHPKSEITTPYKITQ